MRIDYSKSLDDIGPERTERLQHSSEKYAHQVNTARHLLDFPPRKRCILCDAVLVGDKFQHRSLPFIQCARCNHVQSLVLPPKNYPRDVSAGNEFRNVYQKLTPPAYEDRKNRVYRPKLEWIKECLLERGYTHDYLRRAFWLEFGSGAGYFISCLQDEGVGKCLGLEADEALVEMSRDFTPEGSCCHYKRSLTEALSDHRAEIYSAFFVLEHIEDLHAFFERLRTVPKGTIFIFSVPVFGLSCLLEGIFEDLYARNLDGVFHTQLFTDDSIAYGLGLADFSMVAKWIFGQDAEDLHRFIYQKLHERYPRQLLNQISGNLSVLENPLQSVLDQNGLADQRHIIAIKN